MKLEPRKKLEAKLRPALASLSGKSGLVGAEIGVQWGLHANTILNLLRIKKLYLIDPYEQYSGLKGQKGPDTTIHQVIKKSAHARLKQFNAELIWIEEYSHIAVVQIPDNTLDFVYIDGNHKYEFVKRDIELYLPKVKLGGIIGGHDWINRCKGLQIAVREIFGKNFQQSKEDWWTRKE